MTTIRGNSGESKWRMKDERDCASSPSAYAQGIGVRTYLFMPKGAE